MGSTFSWLSSFGWLLLSARGGEKRGSSFSGTGLSVSAFAAEGFLVRRPAREPVDFVDLFDRAEPTELTEASDSFPDISDSDLFLIREERLSGVSTLKTTVRKTIGVLSYLDSGDGCVFFGVAAALFCFSTGFGVVPRFLELVLARLDDLLVGAAPGAISASVSSMYFRIFFAYVAVKRVTKQVTKADDYLL